MSCSEPEKEQLGKEGENQVRIVFSRRMENSAVLSDIEGEQVREGWKAAPLGLLTCRLLVAVVGVFQTICGLGAQLEGQRVSSR